MKFAEAMIHLREGKKIFRSSCPEKGHLYKHEEDKYESFLLNINDLMAKDWEIKNDI